MFRKLALFAAAGLTAFTLSGPSLAQDQGEDGGIGPASDVLIALMAQAREGQGDLHLPFMLTRMKKALSTQDVIAFLDLVDTDYFNEQFAFLAKGGQEPGATLNQFVCEFLQICDVSKTYTLKDVVSGHVLAVAPAGDRTVVRLEMQMWDGVMVVGEILYNPATYRFEGGRG